MARTVATITAASGFQPGLAALDIEEFFRTQNLRRSLLRDDIISKFQRRRGCHHRVATMRNVGERSAMYEGRIVFQRLHQIGLHRVFQQHSHGAIGLDVAAMDRGLVAAVGDDDEPSRCCNLQDSWKGTGSP